MTKYTNTLDIDEQVMILTALELTRDLFDKKDDNSSYNRYNDLLEKTRKVQPDQNK